VEVTIAEKVSPTRPLVGGNSGEVIFSTLTTLPAGAAPSAASVSPGRMAPSSSHALKRVRMRPEMVIEAVWMAGPIVAGTRSMLSNRSGALAVTRTASAPTATAS
jgi:hypothetical protein